MYCIQNLISADTNLTFFVAGGSYYSILKVNYTWANH